MQCFLLRTPGFAPNHAPQCHEADKSRARGAPAWRVVRAFILSAMALPLTGAVTAQDITAWSGNGALSWTNGLVNGVYEVQWSPSLSPGATWTNDWSQLCNLQGTQTVFNVSVPMFYRVKGSAYPEVTDSADCYVRYSNALLNAAVALPSEVSTRLRPVSTNSPGTDWRPFTNWVDGTAGAWVRVATMKFTGAWVWTTLLSPGAHTMSNGYASELWITLCPDLRQLLASYTGTNRTLRIEKALGLPPRTGTYGVAEFYVDPKYLFRPAANPDVRSPSSGLVADNTTPFLSANPFQGISTAFATWFNTTYQNRGYAATNLDNSYPWTRLGYTYDYENSPNSPYGLSEYVVPSCSDTQYWGADLKVPIYVEANYPAAGYGL
jgi:hypothetical protein